MALSKKLGLFTRKRSQWCRAEAVGKAMAKVVELEQMIAREVLQGGEEARDQCKKSFLPNTRIVLGAQHPQTETEWILCFPDFVFFSFFDVFVVVVVAVRLQHRHCRICCDFFGFARFTSHTRKLWKNRKKEK